MKTTIDLGDSEQIRDNTPGRHSWETITLRDYEALNKNGRRKNRMERIGVKEQC